MARVHPLVFVAAVAFHVGGCDSALVTEFNGHAETMCGCADAECAKQAHGKFVASWDAMKSAAIDWNSAQGKRDTKGIEAAVKRYRGCLDPQISGAQATAMCQRDQTAAVSTDACTACCVAQGRFMDAWTDPAAAGLMGALGGGDVQGCTCN